MEFKLKEFETALRVSRIANIHYFEFTKDYYTTCDSHPFRELIYTDSGHIYVEADSYTGKLSKNCIIIHKAGENHSLRCSDEQTPNVIIIGFECDCPLLDAFSENCTQLTPPMQKVLTEVIREGRNVFLPPYDLPGVTDMKKREDYPFGADQMIKLKLEEFLIMLVRNISLPETSLNDTNIGNIANIKAYIDENYNQKISLDELCFLYNTNKTSLCKGFRECYGCTVVEYINKQRISKAKQLMRSGKYSIGEISLKVGFSSPHYLSRIFKNYERLSPSEYTKTIKSKLGI